MTSPSQIAANRVNAQRSTGPRSEEGKAASRFNAFKHGLDAQSLVIPGENAAELTQLSNSLFDELCPQGAVETILVETLIWSEWLRRRYRKVETAVFGRLIVAMDDPGASAADAFIEDARAKNVMGKLFRCRQAAQRDYDKAYAELRRLQEARITDESALSDSKPESQPAGAPPVAPLVSIENRLRSEISPDRQ